MSVGAKLKGKFCTIRTHLTSLDDQPLGKAALTILIFLDIFILASIFDGLDAHTKQLSSPETYIPHTCRQIVVDQQWNSNNRIDNLARIVTASSTSYYRVEEKKQDLHPVCAPYTGLVDQIKIDRALVGILEERKRLKLQAKELQGEIENLKGAYDTFLLEKIANTQERATRAAATKEEYVKKSEALETLKSRIATLEQSIDSDVKIKLLWERLQNLQEQDRQKLLSDLRTMNFWYPVKKLGMQMIFLLPLFMVFYAWNNASIKKNRGLQTLVSSHLLGISFIPILGKIIETVYDIIPKKLLKQLIDLLESLKLVAIWHYLIISLAVAAALFVIYIFQRKLFSHEKVIERRISKGECQQCGKRLPAESSACPFCGFVQYRPCTNCNNRMHVHGKFCQECGKQATN